MATTDPPGKAQNAAQEIPTFARPVDIPSPERRVQRVVVIEGPDAGKTFTLDPLAPTRILVGTSPACEVRLTDPSVSRRHAAFEPVGQRYRLTDLGSTNGTVVDGVMALDVYVRGGEVVRCGSTALRLEADTSLDVPALTNAMRFGRTLGASTVMRRLYPLCERLAATRIPVIIEGETGTGKEVLAESLHEVSESKGPFVVFDCTTVAANIVESELFGHEKGAFTGAAGARAGLFEEANEGTLLIDEIGDLDLALQAKLLRALDRGEIRRMGAQRPIRVDVRVIAATRRDLDREVAAGRFRDDLFHRLAVARIELPPLRDRHGDIPLLARQFATQLGAKATSLPAELIARFETYAWPGNLRELRNAVARFIAVGEDEVASQAKTTALSAPPPPRDSGRRLSDAVDTKIPFTLARKRALEEFERNYVERVLEEHGGNVAQAARASGIALRYFRLVKARYR